MSTLPKYSKPEIERRWLVAFEAKLDAENGRTRIIEDRYILNTRLRLRKVTESGRSPIYKLGKKYESESSGTHQVVTTYLTENEYSVFARLPAKIARKRRCCLYGGSLDVYEHLEVELQVFEIEFASVEEAAAYVPPPFVGREITSETKYSGFALARGEA